MTYNFVLPPVERPLRCPLCDREVVGGTTEVEEFPTVRFDGVYLSPVLAGVVVEESSMPRVRALILDPCQCRVPTVDWTLCIIPGHLWFVHPDEVGLPPG